MTSLWEKRNRQLANRGQGPKAPSVRPPAGMVEPPQKVEVPAAPAAPVAAPEPAPASSPVPVAPAPAPAKAAKLPSPPPLMAPAEAVAPAPSPPKPKSIPPVPAAAPLAPVAESPAPGETSSGSIVVGSGDILVGGASPAPSPDPGLMPLEPEPEPVQLSPLAAILPEEATPEPALLPQEAPVLAKPEAHAAELRRKTPPRSLLFRELSDNGFLPSKYKLTFVGMEGATACKFLLIGRSEKHEVTLELNEPKTVKVQTKGGPMSVTLTYKGVSKTDNAKEVEYTVEGGISAVTGVYERFRGVGPAALSAFRSFVKHLPEAVCVGFAAGLAVCGFTLDWVGAELGKLHPYVTGAVPALMAGLAIWTWAERSKDIKKEMKNPE